MDIVLETVGIVAGEMAATLAFYRAAGLSIPARADGEQSFEFEAPGGVIMGFISETLARQADPQFVTPVGQSMNLQFRCRSPQEVDRVCAALVKAGYTSYAAPWDAFWGQRFGRIVDPDGRVVNFYAALPSS